MAEVHEQWFRKELPSKTLTVHVEHHNLDKQCDTHDLRDALLTKEPWDTCDPMAVLRDTFGDMLRHQLELQRKSFGLDPPMLQGVDRDHYVQAMSTALVAELGEALQELSWKPWATGQWFNRQPYLVELIDLLHFLMNLMLVATDDPDEIIAVYYNKADINAQRQADGYTGEKCPECGR